MKYLYLVPACLALSACVPEGSATSSAPKGPAFEIVQAGRTLDTTRVSMRYKNGGAIPREDESRAVMRAMQIACVEGENPIADTRSRNGGILTVNVFCVGVRTSDEVIDGTRLRT